MKKFTNSKNNKKDCSSDKKVKNAAGNPKRKDHGAYEGYGSDHNDPNWYAANPQLLKDVANISFSSNLGNKVADMHDLVYLDSTLAPEEGRPIDNAEIYIPGVMTVHLMPTLGAGKLATDAPTVAARNIYSFVRHANSGSANYEAPDLMMYILARCSAEAWLTHVERAYGTLLAYSVRNRYYAETVVQAMGFSYASLSTNMVNVRAYINQAKARLNTLKIPGNVPILSRWNYLMGNVFVDDTGAKPQSYIPVFDTYFRFEGYLSDTGTSLTSVKIQSEFADYNDIVRFTEYLLQPLLSEEDVGIMSGDIIKAYGESGLSPIALTAEDYVCLPTYDEAWNSQIHNSFALCHNFDYDRPSDVTSILSDIAHTVIQEGGVIKEDVNELGIFPLGGDELAAGSIEGYLLNAYHDDVTPEQVMVMTRLIPEYKAGALSGCGTELCTGYTIWRRPYDPNAQIERTMRFYNVLPMVALTDFNVVTDLSMFNYHPRLYLLNSTSNMYYTAGVLGDLDNYVYVDRQVISRLNTIAVLSETNISSKTTIK